MIHNHATFLAAQIVAHNQNSSGVNVTYELRCQFQMEWDIRNIASITTILKTSRTGNGGCTTKKKIKISEINTTKDHTEDECDQKIDSLVSTNCYESATNNQHEIVNRRVDQIHSKATILAKMLVHDGLILQFFECKFKIVSGQTDQISITTSLKNDRMGVGQILVHENEERVTKISPKPNVDTSLDENQKMNEQRTESKNGTKTSTNTNDDYW